MTDHPDWDVPTGTASAVYKQTVPLGRKSTLVGAAGGATLGGGLSATLSAPKFWNQVSWQGNVSANLPSGAGSLPFAVLKLTWANNGLTGTIREEDLYLTSGNGAGNIITTGGFGAAKGDWLTAVLTNLDPAQTLTYTWEIDQTSHVYDKTRWAQDGYAGASPVGFQNPSGDPRSDLIASITTGIASGTPQKRLLATRLGKWQIAVDNIAGATPLTLTITDPIGVGAPVNSEYMAASVVAGGRFREDFYAPSHPVLLTLTNTGTTGTITPPVSVIAIDY